jgi:two-component system chemotaxis sensor kinase CheA
MSMNDLDLVIKEFLVESYENLDKLDGELVVLEKEPTNRDLLGSVFRTIHTIKGTCGFLEFAKLEAVTHVGENLLSKLRSGELLLNPAIISGLLALVDTVRRILRNIEATGKEGDEDPAAVVLLLTNLHDGVASNSVVSVASVQDVPTETSPKTAEANVLPQSSTKADLRLTEAAPGVIDTEGSSISDGTLRVDVGLLDRLMNLVGELVLARNQVLQLTAAQHDPAYVITSQRLDLITTELQESVMKTRLQPIDNIWKKFPRVVRDLAISCGKVVHLEMEGGDTELEAIKDPLTHLIRNAVDHGIEVADVRRTRGKAAEGRLFLHAFHEGGQVNIEITDDGGGIDPARVKQKAVERSLVTSVQADNMSERELLQLIFLPGFSTAEKVTSISGRGVGMDVVQTNIERIGGTVDIQSRVELGTTLKIKIPLTLAIIPALIVATGGDRYAIPQVSLLELVRLEGEQARRGIERIGGTPVYRLRGQLLPLVHLGKELQVDANQDDGDVVNIVVLQADGRQFGLEVDAINDTEEIVVKPLCKLFKGNSSFAGATIRGDGKVALILDVLGIAQHAGVVHEVSSRTPVNRPSSETRLTRHTVLLFESGNNERFALPLSQVARLEVFPATAVENANGREVVQYRGRILPLLRLSPEDRANGAQGLLHAVVYTRQGRSVGLVVGRILDIIETPLELTGVASRRGVLGSLVIQNRVTDLLDAAEILRTLEPEFLGSPANLRD